VKESIAAFLGYLQMHEGAPYVFGGNEMMLFVDPVVGLQRHAFGFPVFDCVGLPKCGLRAAGYKDIRATHNADSLWKELEPVERPEPGDFVFYGMADHAAHIETVMQDGRYFGALNGSRHTVVPNAEKARVRYRLTARPDLIGFRKNPLR
jgi:cell wall-associated NlpC family hydrolase